MVTMITMPLPAVSFPVLLTPGSSLLGNTVTAATTATVGPAPLLQMGNFSANKLFAGQPPLEGPPALDPVDQEFSGAVLSASLLIAGITITAIVTGLIAAWHKLSSESGEKAPPKSADVHLAEILEKTRQPEFREIQIRHPIALNDDRASIGVGLEILELWKDQLPKQEEGRRWTMALIMDQPIGYLPPEYRIIVPPEEQIGLRGDEEILVGFNESDVMRGVTLPSVDEMLAKVQELTRQ